MNTKEREHIEELAKRRQYDAGLANVRVAVDTASAAMMVEFGLATKVSISYDSTYYTTYGVHVQLPLARSTPMAMYSTVTLDSVRTCMMSDSGLEQYIYNMVRKSAVHIINEHKEISNNGIL